MTKIEAGKLNIENGLLNLRDVVKSVENILRPKAEEKGLILETSFDELINGRLNGDPTRIRQILMNILSNAIKFTEKGKVQLKLQLQETKGLYQKVSITCLDTGIGISEDVIRFIFNEFYQEYVGGYNGMEGTGLGLSITKKLIHLMNGNIVVTSEKGKWTKVYIEIPLHIDESIQLEVEPPVADLSKEMLEKRILIVEDNKLNRNLFVIMLQNMGCLVTEAENGQEAIDILQIHSFDLVLMDIQMPVMDGLTALSKILDGPNSHTPVIALTATAFKSEVNNLLSQGFADCITKPIDQKNLNLRLCQFFKNHKLEDSHLMAMKERIKARIEDMAGNNQSKAAKLMQYLAEEVKLAIKEWELALITMDWSSARKILHREKMMIQAVGITGLDTIIEDFENENAGKTDHEMHMMLSRLIELFTEIDSMFAS